MKLSQIKNIIKESIKELINEQQGLVPFTNPGGFGGGGNWTEPTIYGGGNGTIYLECPPGYVFGNTGLSPDYNGTQRPMNDDQVIVPSSFNTINGGTKIRITECRKLDLNYVNPTGGSADISNLQVADPMPLKKADPTIDISKR